MSKLTDFYTHKASLLEERKPFDPQWEMLEDQLLKEELLPELIEQLKSVLSKVKSPLMFSGCYDPNGCLSVSFTRNCIQAEGREACEKFADYPRLRYATQEQRANYEADEYGLHWRDIDEDLSFEGFFDKRETTQLYKLFMAHPELNVSAIARRLGISQSLMAQYISGKKVRIEKNGLTIWSVRFFVYLCRRIWTNNDNLWI